MTNALEEAVRATYASLMRPGTEFCSCAQCSDDVITLALNHARPRYVTANSLGAAVTRVALSQDSAKAELAVLVYSAMRTVAEKPRHIVERRRIRAAGEHDLGQMVGEHTVGQRSVGGVELRLR